MATLQQIQDFVGGNPGLKQKFAAARVQAAWDIGTENNPAAPRVAWRNKVLSAPDADLDREYLRFLGHASVQGTSGAAAGTVTDATILTVTKGLVDTFAAIV